MRSGPELASVTSCVAPGAGGAGADGGGEEEADRG